MSIAGRPARPAVVWCVGCVVNPAKYKAKALCMTCYQYERRHGVPRPPALTDTQAQLNWRAHERKMAFEIAGRLRRA